MVPRHVNVISSGKDGITVLDYRNNETFSVVADALKANGWDVPETDEGAGGLKSPVKLFVVGEENHGLVLKDAELGDTYWVSSTALASNGCARRKR